MRVLKDESGAALVLFAVFLGAVALGFLALSLDTGLLFRQRRMAQSAADAAAVAAANEINAGDNTNYQAVANAAAKFNGFDNSLVNNPASVVVTHPYVWNGSNNYVKATVSKPINTYFLGTFLHNPAGVNVSASAIAGGGNSSPTCICLENPTGSDLHVYGGAKIVANSCGIVDDSNASNAAVMTGAANVSALSLGTISSTWNIPANNQNTGTITHIATGLSSGCAPSMPTPPTYNPASCTALGGDTNSFTAGPATSTGVVCYTNLFVGYNNTLDTLKPGIYVITGYLTFQSGNGGVANLGGQGVFFYLTSTATLTIAGGANVNLVAGGTLESDGHTTTPSTGYDGILFYQATGNTNPIQVQGGATTFLNGAILAPSANVVLSNGTSNSVTGGIVAQTLTMYGGATLNAIPSVNEGSLSLSPKIVE
jgi:Flp pilus assembly protein TadG